MLELLSNRSVRYALYYLSAESETSLDRLADIVTGLEATVDGDVGTPADREQIRIRLYHVTLPKLDDAGYLEFDTEDHTVGEIVRDADGEFLGALGTDLLEAILSPEIHPPWVLAERDVDLAGLFDFLDNTIFTFQNADAFAAQAPVYARFARERDVDVRIFVDEAWPHEAGDGVEVVARAGGEIGRFWFVLFDGGGDELAVAGLLAEEHEPGRYYGFWTDDPDFVSDLFAYLDATY